MYQKFEKLDVMLQNPSASHALFVVWVNVRFMNVDRSFFQFPESKRSHTMFFSAAGISQILFLCYKIFWSSVLFSCCWCRGTEHVFACILAEID